MTTVRTDADQVVEELVVANRILANEAVLDGFGHVSSRHPAHPERFLISRSRSPELVEPADIHEFDLDSRPVRTDGTPHYAERVIHGCVYRERPDVTAVCHLHAAPVLPFASTGTAIVPVVHVGAVVGGRIPVWDARDAFGPTDLLVSSLEQGRSLALALGDASAVLMRRHGAVVVGRSLRELVFRAISLKLNAEVQLRAQLLGEISPLTEAEIELAAAANLRPSVLARTWEYWSARLRHLPRQAASSPQEELP